jgi:hypothetical protein
MAEATFGYVPVDGIAHPESSIQVTRAVSGEHEAGPLRDLVWRVRIRVLHAFDLPPHISQAEVCSSSKPIPISLPFGPDHDNVRVVTSPLPENAVKSVVPRATVLLRVSYLAERACWIELRASSVLSLPNL